MTKMTTMLTGVVLGMTAVGCGSEPITTTTSTTLTNTTTVTSLASIADFLASLPDVVAGMPNVDDDDSNGKDDYTDRGGVSGENDLVEMAFPAEVLSMLGNGEKLRFSLVSGDGIRYWNADGDVLMDGSGSDHEFNMKSSSEAESIFVEHDDFLSEGVLNIAHLDSEGEVVTERDLRMLAAPLILNHHVQKAEHVWAMEINQWGGNEQMIDAYTAVLGADFFAVDDGTYGYDVWVQDEIEFATATADGHRLDIVIDSIRDRGLDDLAEDEMEGPDFVVMVLGSGNANSQDSFGNLEVTPPFDDYPFGRAYYGEWGNYGPHDDLTNFLEDQKVQDPFVLDTSWLCVGHVDEFMTFLPDETAPRGFRLIMSNVDMAYEIIDNTDPNMSLDKYRTGHGFSDVGDMANDSALRSHNLELQEDYITPTLETLISIMDLTDEEVIEIPALFEEVSGCYNTNAALVPGTANLIVGNREGDGNQLFVPDPFFREDENDLSSDPFIAEFESLFPASSEIHWIDDWDVYHLGLGEVHCGTNVTRTPDTNWWDDALHLLE